MRAGNGSSILAVWWKKKSVEIVCWQMSSMMKRNMTSHIIKILCKHSTGILCLLHNTSFEWYSENYREHLIVFYENGQLFCRHDVLCKGRITKSTWSKQKGLQSKCHKQCNFRIIWKFPPFRNVYRDPPLKLSFVMVMTHLFDCCQCHYYIFYSIKNW